MAISTIRFTGLASGMDTESIVKSMIAPYQKKVDLAQQNKMLMELKKEAWKEMNTKIYDFYKDGLSNLKFNSSYGKSDVAISNPNVIKLDKNVSMPAGNHTIDVTQIAKGATVFTNKITKDKDGNDITPTKQTKLEELGLEVGDIITVNGKELTVRAEEKVGEVVTIKATTIGDIENLLKEDTNINAKFDETLGAFIISTKNTGDKKAIGLTVKNASGTDETATKMGNLGIKPNDKGTYEYKGQNANFTYNGGVTVESESNNIDINGLKATIIGVSKGEPASISAVKDTQATIDFVKGFVSNYNELIGEMNARVGAPRNKDYKPLTSQQKESMSESDIKLWEKKVNDSILRNDPVLKELSADMRRIVGDSELFKIGVSTGSDWTEKGKLYVNETKLKKMLEEDPSKIDEVFKDVGTKLYDKISEKLLKGNKIKSANYMFNDKWLKEQIDASDKKIMGLESRLAAQESLYYKKFTAMEKMLGKLKRQGDWFSGQVGGN